MELKVHIEASIDISFGLAFLLSASAVFFNVMKVIMSNSIALVVCIMASVWYGAAFLRRPVGKTPTRARDRYAQKYAAFQE